jgi:hypothetical protein
METNLEIQTTPEPEVDEVTAYGFGATPIGSPTKGDTPAVSMVPRPEDYREYSTTTELLGQIPTGLAQGAVEAAPVAAGTAMGLGIGMKVAPFTGPFAPLTVLVGGGLGMYAGSYGEDAMTALAKKYDLFPDPTRPDQTAFREGAKTAGGALPFMGLARFLPEAADNFVSRLVSSYGRSARETPKLFLSTEALGATGSGVGGGIAEAAYPGDPLAKFGLEFAGGTFFP